MPAMQIIQMTIKCKTMQMFNPSHPGELVRETLDGLREETGQKLTIAEVLLAWGLLAKPYL